MATKRDHFAGWWILNWPFVALGAGLAGAAVILLWVF